MKILAVLFIFRNYQHRKNEVMEMIAKARERKGRLDLPIVSGKHLRKISDRTALQSADSITNNRTGLSGERKKFNRNMRVIVI